MELVLLKFCLRFCSLDAHVTSVVFSLSLALSLFFFPGFVGGRRTKLLRFILCNSRLREDFIVSRMQ